MTESGRAWLDRYGPEARYAVERSAELRTTPWLHATDLLNVPPEHLVQIGIGGWPAPRPGVQVGQRSGGFVPRERVIGDPLGCLVGAGHLSSGVTVSSPH